MIINGTKTVQELQQFTTITSANNEFYIKATINSTTGYFYKSGDNIKLTTNVNSATLFKLGNLNTILLADDSGYLYADTPSTSIIPAGTTNLTISNAAPTTYYGNYHGVISNNVSGYLNKWFLCGSNYVDGQVTALTISDDFVQCTHNTTADKVNLPELPIEFWGYVDVEVPQEVIPSNISKVYVGSQLVYQKPAEPEWIEQYSSTNATYGGRYITFDNGTNWTKITSSSDPYYVYTYGIQIWTDGTYLYSSEGTGKQYKFNDTTKKWDTITWNVDVTGSVIWTDGIDIFYTDDSSNQYKLNLSTNEWEAHTWGSGSVSSVKGSQIWTDGTDIYYSNSGNIYVYSRANNNWTAVTFTNDPAGNDTYYIWSDGIDTYYSNGTTHKILDKSTKTWSDMTWTSSPAFKGNEVIHWNNKIYMRQSATPYKFFELDIANHTWTASSEMINPLTSSKNNFRPARMFSKHGRLQNGAQPFTYRQ